MIRRAPQLLLALAPLALTPLTGCAPCERMCVVADELPAGLLSVRARAEDDVWVVGAGPDAALDSGAAPGPVLAQFDGSGWTRLDTSAWEGLELWWAHVTADQGVFVGNGGLILELDRASGALEQIEGPAEDTTFFGVWCDEQDDCWAVGWTEAGQGPPALWRRQAGAWAAWSDPDEPGLAGETWFKVDGRAPDDVWIVGSQGASLRWDGSALTRLATDADLDTGNTPLLTVTLEGDQPIAVGGQGNGVVLEHDGSAWRDRSPDFQPGYNGVCAHGDSAWAVGQSGVRAQREGGAWLGEQDVGLDPITLLDWHACSIDPAGNVWAVGGRIASRPLNRGVVGYLGSGRPAALEL